MSRKREIEELGGRPEPERSEAEIISDALATWTSRGQVPPALRELVDDLGREAEAPQASRELFERFVALVHEQVVHQINRIEKVPLTVSELRLGPDLSGVAVMYEPRHVCLSDFEASIDFEAEGAPLTWSVIDSGRRYTFPLGERLDAQGLARLRAVLRAPEPAYFAGCYRRIAETWLKLGEDLPWRDRYADRREKYRRALPFLEKALALTPEDRLLAEKARRVRGLAGDPKAGRG